MSSSPAKSTRKTVRRPGGKALIGQSQINESDLRGLKDAWASGDLTLFLGAGVSLPYGIPPWRDLVLELLYDQAQKAERFRPLWPHYLRALTSWMADHFDYNPIILARLIEHDIHKRGTRDPAQEFVNRLRHHLYSRRIHPAGDTTLRAIARMIQKSSKGNNLAATFTFNFDDLLEQELRELKLKPVSQTKGGRKNSGALNIIHPHGFIPETGAASRDGLVFTENDYHHLTDSNFHWALTEIVAHLRQHRGLFIGLSMSDPNLRRLLDASRFPRDRPWHWQIQKRHQVNAAAIPQVAEEIERRAAKFGEQLNVPLSQRKSPAELHAVITETLKQADSYDRQVFEAMGVKTIWINDWSDLPELIDAISR